MNARMPYRAPSPVAVPADPPREMTFRSTDLESHRGASRKLYETLFIAAIPAAAISLMLGHEAGIACMGVAFAIGMWRWHSSQDVHGVVLRVDGRSLVVTRKRPREVLLDVPLKDLEDVLLDTKTIQKLRRNTALGAMNVGTSVDGAVDVSRVVLLPRDPHDPVPLTESHIAHTDAVEAAAKVRRFLRAHRWVPEDER